MNISLQIAKGHNSKTERNPHRERENKETEIFVTNTARPKYY